VKTLPRSEVHKVQFAIVGLAVDCCVDVIVACPGFTVVILLVVAAEHIALDHTTDHNKTRSIIHFFIITKKKIKMYYI
jgi:hypothetical protein